MDHPQVTLDSRFPSELGDRGTMRLPNRKEEQAQLNCTSAQIKR
jgi:DNA-binding response OmpR family regulator